MLSYWLHFFNMLVFVSFRKPGYLFLFFRKFQGWLVLKKKNGSVSSLTRGKIQYPLESFISEINQMLIGILSRGRPISSLKDQDYLILLLLAHFDKVWRQSPMKIWSTQNNTRQAMNFKNSQRHYPMHSLNAKKIGLVDLFTILWVVPPTTS